MRRCSIAIVVLSICICSHIRIALAQPAAIFSVQSTPPVCSPAAINFTNNSTGDGPLTYLWEFGINNETDTSAQTGFLYDSCGIFEVILTVTDTSGLTSSDTQQVYIACNPAAEFSFTPGTVCDTAQVEFLSENNAEDSIVSWLWNFGDPSSGVLNFSDTENSMHYYDEAGVFVIELLVTSIQGCTATATDSLLLFDPQASFSLLDSACLMDTTSFIDLSTSQDSIIAWSWNFDDPTSGANVSIKQNPIHIYKTAGDYNVRLTVTTENGCSNALKKMIHIHEYPEIYAGDDVAICSGDTVHLSATGGQIYAWNPSDFLSSPFIADPFAFPLSTVQLQVTGTDSIGCSAADTVVISVIPLPVANAGNDSTICEGNTAVLHGSGGTSYLWAPAALLDYDTLAQPTAFPQATTTFSLTVQDSSGCVAYDSVVLTVAPLPEVSIIDFNGQYCKNSSAIILNAIPAGGIFSGDGVSNGSFYPDSLEAGGPYTINYFYTDSIGCAGHDTVLVFVVEPAPVSISPLDSILCLNQMPVAFEVTPAGGSFTGNGIMDTMFDPSIAGVGNHMVYYMTLDSNNCLLYDSVSMQVLDLAEIEASNDTFVCAGDSVQIMATGGISYSWTPTDFLTDSLDSDPIAFPLITTVFVVSGTDSNLCTNSDSVLISVLVAESADAGQADTICAGDTIQLHATGGDKYSWLPAEGLNATNIPDPMASPAVTTLYTVTVNPGSSCPGVDSVLITVNSRPDVVSGNDQMTCKGDTVQLLAEGAVFYTWIPANLLTDDSVSNPLAFADTTTNFVVTGIDDNGCSDTDTTIITVIPLPVIDAGMDSTICYGDTLQLMASGGESYQWAPSAFLDSSDIAKPIAFPDSTVTFFVNGTGVSGCSSIDSVIITVLTAEEVDAGSDTSICLGDSILLQATGGNQFAWAPPDQLSDASVSSPTAFPDVTTVYTVSVTVSANCIFSDTVTIVVNDLPAVDGGNDSLICLHDSLQLNATGALSYNWSPDALVSNPGLANPFAFPDETTTFTVTGTDVNGCMNNDTVKVTVLPLPVITISPDTAICEGNPVMLYASGGISFTWQPTQFLSDPFVSDPVAAPDSTTTFIVEVGDGTCFNFDSVVVTVHPRPLASAGEDQQICADIPTQLQASGGESYLWVPETGLSSPVISNPTSTISESMTYVVFVTDSNSCVDTDTIHLEVAPPLEASVVGDTTICLGGSAPLMANGGSDYTWFPPSSLDDAFIHNPLATPDETTQYNVIISDGICYSDTLQVLVVVSVPEIDAGEDITLVSGTSAQLLAEGTPGTYAWSPAEQLSCADCLNPVATPFNTTTYTITVTDTAGCQAIDTILVSVTCTAETLFVPNGFSPDDNGHNDVFLVRTTGLVDLVYLRIFDRWGKVIFESKEIELGWDGSYNGTTMPAGVYLYTLQASCGNGSVITKQGNITLLR